MTITDRVVLVTGANRGIGRALVEEALARGARPVYVGTRHELHHADERVTPLTLDVTNAQQVRRAVEQVDELDLLINNAGVAIYDDLSDPDVVAPDHQDVRLVVRQHALLSVTPIPNQ